MEKLRLDLDALVPESFAVPGAVRADGTVDAYEAGTTHNCATPLCTAGTSCI